MTDLLKILRDRIACYDVLKDTDGGGAAASMIGELFYDRDSDLCTELRAGAIAIGVDDARIMLMLEDRLANGAMRSDAGTTALGNLLYDYSGILVRELDSVLTLSL